MRKICVTINSRANYGRIKQVLKAIQAHPSLELQIITGASALLHRYGQVRDIIEADGFKIDATVYSIVEGENPVTMAKSTGLGIIEMATLFENLRPDIALTVADRFDTLATAVAASYMNIPLAHTQGGEVTGSIDESVRHAVTKFAHLHFPATELAAKNLVRMGENPAFVHCVGCPAIDAIASADLSLPREIFEREQGVGAKLDPTKPYLVVLQHPVTTEYGQGYEQIKATLDAIARLQMQTIWLWPNVDAGSDDVSKGLREFREKHKPQYLHFYRNFPVEEYARLINNCACLVGNSSSGLREGAFLGVPVVNIGTRQLGREHADNVIFADHDVDDIQEKIIQQVEHGKYESSTLFGDGQSSERIADILATSQLQIQKRLNYND